MATKSIRLNADLIYMAKSAAALQHRSIPNQVEYWANLGRMISSVIGFEDAFAVIQGLKQVRVESRGSISVKSDKIFNELESDRGKRFKNKPVTSAPFYYEASIKTDGLLDRVCSLTGERKTGRFLNGKFLEIDAQ